MPTKKSAKKYTRVTKRNTARNRKVKIDFKTAVKKVLTLVKESKFDEAKVAFQKAQKSLDKASKSGVIKKNTASRKKSRLAKAIKKK